MKLKLIQTLILGFVGVASAGMADAACERHIYNDGHKPWTFQAKQGAGKQGVFKGNVYFNGITCQNKINGPCMIPPKTIVSITYTSTGGAISGDMRITDSQGSAKDFYYNNDTEGLNGNCPKIEHSGNTGGVSMNAKANGDFAIGRDVW